MKGGRERGEIRSHTYFSKASLKLKRANWSRENFPSWRFDEWVPSLFESSTWSCSSNKHNRRGRRSMKNDYIMHHWNQSIVNERSFLVLKLTDLFSIQQELSWTSSSTDEKEPFWLWLLFVIPFEKLPLEWPLCRWPSSCFIIVIEWGMKCRYNQSTR